MTIAPKKKTTSSSGSERNSITSRQATPEPENGVQKNCTRSPSEISATTAAALVLRSKLAKRGGCRVLADTAVQHIDQQLDEPHAPKISTTPSEPKIKPVDKGKKAKKTVSFAQDQATQNNKAECSTGYNSDDEYGEGFRNDELETDFVRRMKKDRGFDIVEMDGDGNCMFRAVAHQVYGDQKWHDEVRKLCMDYLAKNKAEFSSFVTEDINEYIERKRKLDVHGNHLELQVITEIYARPIEIYQYNTKPMKSFTPAHPLETPGQANAPIRLSYHGKTHYNAVVDPFNPTIGVGLGLPELNPGEADRNLMADALHESESQDIEEAMLKDKLSMSDRERTEKEINDAEYLKGRANETSQNSETFANAKQESHQSSTKEQHSVVSTCSHTSYGVKRGASSPNLPGCSHEDPQGSYTKSRKLVVESTSMPNIDNCEPGPSTSWASRESSSYKNDCTTKNSGLYEELLSAQSFDNDESDLARAIALSSKEYMDSLSKNRADESD
uniref:ubiquitinyl hydrolase 1 n=1 Tax=Steinernema glaseri TaxID=37863 RepID=A0A1I8ATC8_9BILA